MNYLNKYNDFSVFVMSSVMLALKNSPSCIQYQTVREDLEKVLGEGWDFFISLLSLIDYPQLTENDYMSIVRNTKMTALILTLGKDSETGGSELIINLHKHREILRVLKDVGVKYKDIFENHKGERIYIDTLIDKMAKEIV